MMRLSLSRHRCVSLLPLAAGAVRRLDDFFAVDCLDADECLPADTAALIVRSCMLAGLRQNGLPASVRSVTVVGERCRRTSWTICARGACWSPAGRGRRRLRGPGHGGLPRCDGGLRLRPAGRAAAQRGQRRAAVRLLLGFAPAGRAAMRGGGALRGRAEQAGQVRARRDQAAQRRGGQFAQQRGLARQTARPSALPASRQAWRMRASAHSSAGWSHWPARPRSAARSCAPMNSRSSPSTEAMASTASSVAAFDHDGRQHAGVQGRHGLGLGQVAVAQRRLSAGVGTAAARRMAAAGHDPRRVGRRFDLRRDDAERAAVQHAADQRGVDGGHAHQRRHARLAGGVADAAGGLQRQGNAPGRRTARPGRRSRRCGRSRARRTGARSARRPGRLPAACAATGW